MRRPHLVNVFNGPSMASFMFLVFSNANKCEKLSILVVSSSGIQTHDLSDKSLLPYPLDQGSCPCVVNGIQLLFTQYEVDHRRILRFVACIVGLTNLPIGTYVPTCIRHCK